MGVFGLDLIALGNKLELLGILDHQFDCTLRSLQRHRLLGRIESDYVSDNSNLPSHYAAGLRGALLGSRTAQIVRASNLLSAALHELQCQGLDVLGRDLVANL